MQKNKLTQLLIGLGLAGTLAFAAGTSYASAFQIWEQNGAGTGDYHAGAAAEANDASTAWYNPAGLTRLKHPQVVLGGVGIHTDIPYKGTAQVSLPALGVVGPTTPVDAQGGGWNAVPFGYFAMPINDQWAFGFGVLVPFGLDTDYGDNTALRYAATDTSVKVIDVTPDIAYQLNKVISLGAGFDAEYLDGTFDQYATIPGALPSLDTTSDNSGHSWGYGGHFGALFQFTSNTRFGITYHTQIVEHMKGTSKFTGPLANFSLMTFSGGGVQTSNNLKAKVTLPAFVALSGFEQIDPQWALLGSATYTFWDSFNKLVLQNVSALNTTTLTPTNTATVNIAEDFHDTWNFALGVHYAPITKLILKAGIGYDQTPTRDSTRNAQLPDENRFALALGVHYQLLKQLGVDVGYTHLFIDSAKINNVQPVAGEVVTTRGNVDSDADVVGAQLTWTFC